MNQAAMHTGRQGNRNPNPQTRAVSPGKSVIRRRANEIARSLVPDMKKYGKLRGDFFHKLGKCSGVKCDGPLQDLAIEQKKVTANSAALSAYNDVLAAKYLADKKAYEIHWKYTHLDIPINAEKCAKNRGNAIKNRIRLAEAAAVLLGGAWLVKAAGGPAKVYDWLQQLAQGDPIKMFTEVAVRHFGPVFDFSEKIGIYASIPLIFAAEGAIFLAAYLLLSRIVGGSYRKYRSAANAFREMENQIKHRAKDNF